MSASVEPYLSLVQKAYDGRLKLPAFQREWKWKTSQVILLFDSLRQGFPIGGFLFFQRSDQIDLAPREFRGSQQGARDRLAEMLVLDGQQRITAGLELFYGESGTQYFINLQRLWEKAQAVGLDLSSTGHIRSFLNDLDTDDRYCIARRASADPAPLLTKNHLLWTALLMDDIELERAIKSYKRTYPEREDFVDYVLGKNFRPSEKSAIPITTIEGDVTVEAISRIFSTLNSTGKMLTPFELVVSILFPHQINLAEDVEVAREAYPFYGRIDPTGDILLQTVALFAGRDTKKAKLPRTIDLTIYKGHRDDALKYLDEAGRLLTQRFGLGLDQSDELLVYPVIFSPMAYVLKVMAAQPMGIEQRATAERKIIKWFIGAVLGRWYQQSTHDKQARDKIEILKWIEGTDDDMPQWLKETYIPNLRASDPDSAIGKLLRAIVNLNAPMDPYTGKTVGVGSGRSTTSRHHVFPTRFAKSLAHWNDREDSTNVALNIMYCEQTTNASWLHLDPAIQVAKSLEINQTEQKLKDIYLRQGITDECLAILKRPQKSRDDFYEFISCRETYFVLALEGWGFRRPFDATVGESEQEIEDE